VARFVEACKIRAEPRLGLVLEKYCEGGSWLGSRLARTARRAAHLPPKYPPPRPPRDLNLNFSPSPTPSIHPRPLPAPPATDAGYLLLIPFFHGTATPGVIPRALVRSGLGLVETSQVHTPALRPPLRRRHRRPATTPHASTSQAPTTEPPTAAGYSPVHDHLFFLRSP
jgi:hypothetical protein